MGHRFVYWFLALIFMVVGCNASFLLGQARAYEQVNQLQETQKAEGEVRSKQLEIALGKDALSFKAVDKEITLKVAEEWLAFVIRKDHKTDQKHLEELYKEKTELPSPVIKTAVGTLYSVARKDLRGVDELKQKAKNGQMPPVFTVYKYGKNLVYTDGSFVVKLKDSDKSADLLKESQAARCIAKPFTAPAPGADPDTYVMIPGDLTQVMTAFAGAKLFAAKGYVLAADPVFIMQEPEETAPEENGKSKTPETTSSALPKALPKTPASKTEKKP